MPFRLPIGGVQLSTAAAPLYLSPFAWDLTTVDQDGANAWIDNAAAIASDGSVRIASFNADSGYAIFNAFLTKISAAGGLLWRKALTVAGYYMTAEGCAVDAAGNTYVAFQIGQSAGSATPNNVALGKFDTDGALVWFKQYASATWANLYAGNITVDETNGKLLVWFGGDLAATGTRIILAIVDMTTGALTYQRVIDTAGTSPSSSVPSGVIRASNGEIVLGGQSADTATGLVVRLSADGSTVVWAKALSSSGDVFDVVEDGAGAIYAAGRCHPAATDLIALTKLVGATGAVTWTTGVGTGRGAALQAFWDGTHIVTACDSKEGGPEKPQFITWDTSGNIVSQQDMADGFGPGWSTGDHQFALRNGFAVCACYNAPISLEAGYSFQVTLTSASYGTYAPYTYGATALTKTASGITAADIVTTVTAGDLVATSPTLAVTDYTGAVSSMHRGVA